MTAKKKVGIVLVLLLITIGTYSLVNNPELIKSEYGYDLLKRLWTLLLMSGPVNLAYLLVMHGKIRFSKFFTPWKKAFLSLIILASFISFFLIAREQFHQIDSRWSFLVATIGGVLGLFLGAELRNLQSSKRVWLFAEMAMFAIIPLLVGVLMSTLFFEVIQFVYSFF